jgi:hypothetical protein
MTTRAVNLISASVVAVTLAACKHTDYVTDSQRWESAEGLTTRRVAGSWLDCYLQQRTAVLLCGSMVASSARATGETLSVEFRGAPNTTLGGPAHAVAIAADGYFLTAAHCLHDGYVNYLVYTDGSCARIAAARTVYRVWDPAKGLDCAILHVDAELPYVFEWARAKDPTVGTAVVAVGQSVLRRTGELSCCLSQMCFGGRIVGIQRLGGDSLEVRSDIPARKGDSGGPVATVEGKLVAIDVRKHFGPLKSFNFSVSLRPDPAWVDRVIQEDRVHWTGPSLPPIPEASQATNAALVVVVSVSGDPQRSAHDKPEDKK